MCQEAEIFKDRLYVPLYLLKASLTFTVSGLLILCKPLVTISVICVRLLNNKKGANHYNYALWKSMFSYTEIYLFLEKKTTLIFKVKLKYMHCILQVKNASVILEIKVKQKRSRIHF